MDLFESNNDNAKQISKAYAPLAERIRPNTLAEFIGQEHILGEGKSLRQLIEKDEVPSLIFWGPPGSGKTTLARLIANQTNSDFFQLSAVSSGIKEVREVVDYAEKNIRYKNKRTILFIDEIHRFNKAQQDALLHSVEDGVITLIGATTENPSFEVISPLLSRCRIYTLEPLSKRDLIKILQRAIETDKFMKSQKILMNEEVIDYLILLSGGDARIMLNGFETCIKLSASNSSGEKIITKELVESALQKKAVQYDKAGEEHYNIISAFIKSIRGSDPDAAVYWLARMIEAGEDPKFIARRMIILASEDIGNADPYALTLATSCFTAIDYVGMPEGRIILAQTATYLASVPKSNSSYKAIEEAIADVRNLPSNPVPLHLRNAPTKLMKELGYADEYKYAHDFKENFVEQQYLPDNLKDKIYYRPTDSGREKILKERLNNLWKKKR